MNKKLKWSLLVARETVVEQDRVKALNSDRNALEKKAGLSVVSWNRRYLAAQLRKESDRWFIIIIFKTISVITVIFFLFLCILYTILVNKDDHYDGLETTFYQQQNDSEPKIAMPSYA